MLNGSKHYSNSANILKTTELNFIFGMRSPKSLDITSDMKTSWMLWKQQFEFYAEATNLNEQPMRRQVAVFMTCIGLEALKIYNTFTLTAEQKNQLEYVKAAFEAKFIPKTNVRFERFILNKIVQKEYNDFEDFYLALQLQIKKCDYGVLYNDDLLIDRIVFGINNDELRVKLFNIENLTLDKVVQMCIDAEQCSKIFLELKRREKDIEVIEKETFTKKRDYNVINNTRNYVKLDSTDKLESSRYKTLHNNKKCHASKINHNKCILVRNDEKKYISKARKNNIKETCDLGNELVSDQELYLEQIRHRKKNCVQPKELKLTGKNVKFKLDTDVQCNAVSESSVSTFLIYVIEFKIH